MQVAEVVWSSPLTPRRLTLRHSLGAFSLLLACLLAVDVSLLGLAQAQSTSDFFLHGTGANANPPTLFLDTTAPTNTTAKYKDSTSINFSGGNPWKEVSTWPAAPALTAGLLSALSDLHVWLGLKNSDDQGTQFDLQAELYRNGVLLTSGLTRCITGVTRNPALAKEVTAAFAPFTPPDLQRHQRPTVAQDRDPDRDQPRWHQVRRAQ